MDQVLIANKDGQDYTETEFPSTLSVITAVDQPDMHIVNSIVLPDSQLKYTTITVQNNKKIGTLNVIIAGISLVISNTQSISVIYYGLENFKPFSLIYDSSITPIPAAILGNYTIAYTNPGPPFVTLTADVGNTMILRAENDISFGFDIIIPAGPNNLHIADKFNLLYYVTGTSVINNDIWYQIIDKTASSLNIIILPEDNISTPNFSGITAGVTLVSVTTTQSSVSCIFSVVSIADVTIRIRQFSATTGAGVAYQNGSTGRLLINKLVAIQ